MKVVIKCKFAWNDQIVSIMKYSKCKIVEWIVHLWVLTNNDWKVGLAMQKKKGEKKSRAVPRDIYEQHWLNFWYIFTSCYWLTKLKKQWVCMCVCTCLSILPPNFCYGYLSTSLSLFSLCDDYVGAYILLLCTSFIFRLVFFSFNSYLFFLLQLVWCYIPSI